MHPNPAEASSNEPAVETSSEPEGAAPPDPETREPEAIETAGERIPPSWWFFAVVTVVSAALDLVSKEWATFRLSGFDPVAGGPKRLVIIPGLFDLQYALNPGGAWSMLRSLPEVGRRPFFLVVSTMASVFIASIYGRIDRRQWSMRWGLPLALGGAVGNLVDRIRHGQVVDFLHFFWKSPGREYHWPTFNVADVWIVAGVILMGLDMFSKHRFEPAPPPETQTREA